MNGVEVSSTSTLTDTLLAADASCSVQPRPRWFAVLGAGPFDSFTVQATVDGEGAWDELIETNNSLEADVDVEDP